MSAFLTILQIVLILAGGFLLTHRLFPFVLLRTMWALQGPFKALQARFHAASLLDENGSPASPKLAFLHRARYPLLLVNGFAFLFDDWFEADVTTSPKAHWIFRICFYRDVINFFPLIIPFYLVINFPRKLTPMWHKRIGRFKTIRRGYYSFRIITTLFVVSFCLELMVNNKAIFIRFGDNWAMPAVKEWVGIVIPGLTTYNKRSDFGQVGSSEVDYRLFQKWSRDPALCRAEIAKEKFTNVREASALLSLPLPGPSDPRARRLSWNGTQIRIDAGKERILALEEAYEVYKAGRAFCLLPLYPFSPKEHLLLELEDKPPTRPSLSHILGTDDSGLDVFTFLVYGFRISLLFAIIVASIGYTVGVIVGGVMGYYGGWTDILVQRFIEIWSSIPFLYTIMIISSAFTPRSVFEAFAILAVLMVLLRSWMGITYTIRGEFYREKARDYVQAAIAMGASDWKVMTRHILPNALVPVVTFAPFGIVAYIGSLVSLDYLGFGFPVGTPSWGHLLSQGQTHILLYPHLILAPSVALMLTLFCVVMIGEAVREAFDPKVFSRLR